MFAEGTAAIERWRPRGPSRTPALLRPAAPVAPHPLPAGLDTTTRDGGQLRRCLCITGCRVQEECRVRPRQDGSGFLAAPRLSSGAVPMDGNQSRPGPEETGGGRRREGETAAGSTLNFNSRVPCGRLNLGGQRPVGKACDAPTAEERGVRGPSLGSD